LPGSEQKPGWQGKLVTDDFSGYKACFELGVTEVGCMAHARRKFHELWVHHQSAVGERALKFFIQLYEIEREVRDLPADERRVIRQDKTKRIADALQQWLTQQRQKVPDGSATAKAIDYSLKRWKALVRFIDDGELPIDNNWVENQIRPIAIGRNNWLFAGSLRAGKRAAAVMSLVHSARLNGHEPHAYIRDVLERLPTQPASRIDELLPHRWSASRAAS
jgi:transposase